MVSAAEINAHRMAILRAIRERPGVTVQELMRLVGCARSPVRYHLQALLEKNLVRTERIGQRLCIFPKDVVPASDELVIRRFFASPTRLRIARALAASGPQPMEALAARTFLSRRLVAYHLQALAEQDYVEKKDEEGPPHRYAASTALAEALRALSS